MMSCSGALKHEKYNRAKAAAQAALCGPFLRRLGWVLLFLQLAFMVCLLWRGMASGLEVHATGELVMLDIWLQTTAMMLALWLLFSPRVGVWVFAGALALAYWSESTGFFFHQVHDVFMSLDVYPQVVARANGSYNPAYARIGVALMVLALLVAGFGFPSRRQLSRLVGAVVLSLTILSTWGMHWLAIEGGANQSIRLQQKSMALAAEAPEKFVQPICRQIGAQCWVGSLQEVLAADVEPVVRDHVRLVVKRTPLQPGSAATMRMFSSVSVPSAKDAMNGHHNLVLHKTADERYRLVLVTDDFRRLMYFWQVVYALPAVLMHLLLIFGGFYVALFFRRPEFSEVPDGKGSNQ